MRGIPDLTQPPRRWWPILTALAAAVVVVSFVLALVGLAARHVAAANMHPEDVQVVGCTAGALGELTGQLLVVNGAQAAASYTVTVRFETPDGRTLATTTGYVLAVAPGGSSRTSIFGYARGAAAGPLHCTVVSAARTAG